MKTSVNCILIYDNYLIAFIKDLLQSNEELKVIFLTT
jgi:hypothetical protein